MQPGLDVGATAEVAVITTPAMAITFDGPPKLSVFSTPSMLWQMEMAAHEVLKPYLDPGEASVGVTANVSHSAPTPIGMKVTARARVTAIDRRRVSFAIEVFDEKEKIGEGTHDRFVIDVARFASRVEQKSS